MRMAKLVMAGLVLLTIATDIGRAQAGEAVAMGEPGAMAMMTPPVAAVLPSSRSVGVGTPATAFATMMNTGSGMVTGCGMTAPPQMSGAFMYQATDPNTNQPIGMPNSPMDMPMGGSQTFMFAFTPAAPMDPTDMPITFSCANTGPAEMHPGLNTLLVSASATPVPDMVAMSATVGHDGIVNVPGANGTGAFAVATVNMGAGGPITASVDTGGVDMAVSLQLCQTDPASGRCVSAMGQTIPVQVDAGMTPTFGVFVSGHGMVVFDPTANRVFVRFSDAAGFVRGATSVAVRTQ